MAAELIIAPEAEEDVANAYAWYESRKPGLGEEFLGCVDACIEAIRRTPHMHALVHENYRRGLVRRFPFAVFYDSTGDAVTIYCVFHLAQSRQMAPASSLAVDILEADVRLFTVKGGDQDLA